MMSLKVSFVVVALMVLHSDLVHGHGMLMEPVNRGSAWRKGFNTPVNYDDDGNYCGGLSVQIANGGKCGVCGDNFALSQPRPNENGGKYGVGQVVQTYRSGEKIQLTAKITANHAGYFKFSICPLQHATQLETEECFNKYPIQLESGDKYVLPNRNKGDFSVHGTLPAGLKCERCVLRWEYVAGNNWAICPDGTGHLGCGQQETFKTCSDITIV